MRTTILRPDDYLVMPWKNGRGTTTQIAVAPRNATTDSPEFLWRISIASVPESGPFSRFPEIDRTIVVLDGAGMTLTHGDGSSIRLPSLHPYQFEGEAETHCELVEGPVTDLNLMTRRGRASGRISILRGAAAKMTRAITGSIAFLYVVRGDATVQSTEGDAVVAEGETLQIESGSGIKLAIAMPADGTVAFIDIG